MRLSTAFLCLVLCTLGGISQSRFLVGDKRLSEDDELFIVQAPQQAQLPTESPTAPAAGAALSGSLLQATDPLKVRDCDPELSSVMATDPMKVRDWDPELSSFMVRSKQPGTGCHQLSSVKQPLQQRMPGVPSNATNYFFRGSSGIGGAASGLGDGSQGDTGSGSQDDGATASTPCADLPLNIFAALSRDGYVRHTALSGDPEFR